MEDEVCPICQQQLKESPEVTALDGCGHRFCTQCIIRNFRSSSNKSCPVCRHIGISESQHRIKFSSSSSDDDEEDEEEYNSMRNQHRRLIRRVYLHNRRSATRLRAAKSRLEIATRELRSARRAAMRDHNYKKARSRYATVRRQVINAEAIALNEESPGDSVQVWRDVCAEKYPTWYDESGFNHTNSVLADILDSLTSDVNLYNN